MLVKFNSLILHGITAILLITIAGMGTGCNHNSNRHLNYLENENSSTIRNVNKKDTSAIVKTNKTSQPQDKTELLSADLNEPVLKAQQPVLIPINKSTQQLVSTADFSRKSVILEITISYKTHLKNSYTVYIDTDEPNLKKIAGYMNFFGLQDPVNHQETLVGSKKFLFDITDEFDIRTLRDNMKLLFVNSSGKPVNEITVDKVRLETRNLQ